MSNEPSGEAEELRPPAAGEIVQKYDLVPQREDETPLVEHVRERFKAVEARFQKHHPDFDYLFRNEAVKAVTDTLARGVDMGVGFVRGYLGKDDSDREKNFAEAEAIRAREARENDLHEAAKRKANAEADEAEARADQERTKAIAERVRVYQELRAAGMAVTLDDKGRLLFGKFKPDDPT